MPTRKLLALMVTLLGASLIECELGLSAPPDCPRADAPVQVVFQYENTGADPQLFASVVDEPLADDLPELVLLPGEGRVWVAIVSQLEEGQGVQAWTLSIAAEGDLEVAGATVDGTTADLAERHPFGLRQGGFQRTEIVDPTGGSIGEPQGHGVVSATVLAFSEAVMLPARGTATVLAIDLAGTRGARGVLRPRDGLRGSGGPVVNSATVLGASHDFDCHQQIAVRFGTPERPFRRGDANDDGVVDLADAVKILTVLFLGTSRFDCRDAADTDDDARVNIADAVALLHHLYLGGPPPAPPRPTDPCGRDPEPHTRDGCARYRSC